VQVIVAAAAVAHLPQKPIKRKIFSAKMSDKIGGNSSIHRGTESQENSPNRENSGE
jgi:hypothetical protein